MPVSWRDHYEWGASFPGKFEEVRARSLGVLEEEEIWHELNPRVVIEGGPLERQMRLSGILSNYQASRLVPEYIEEVLFPLTSGAVSVEGRRGASYRQLVYLAALARLGAGELALLGDLLTESGGIDSAQAGLIVERLRQRGGLIEEINRIPEEMARRGRIDRAREMILKAISCERAPLTRKQLRPIVVEHRGLSNRALLEALEELVEEGKVTQSGRGLRNAPYRYGLS